VRGKSPRDQAAGLRLKELGGIKNTFALGSGTPNLWAVDWTYKVNDHLSSTKTKFCNLSVSTQDELIGQNIRIPSNSANQPKRGFFFSKTVPTIGQTGEVWHARNDKNRAKGWFRFTGGLPTKLSDFRRPDRRANPAQYGGHSGRNITAGRQRGGNKKLKKGTKLYYQRCLRSKELGDSKVCNWDQNNAHRCHH